MRDWWQSLKERPRRLIVILVIEGALALALRLLLVELLGYSVTVAEVFDVLFLVATLPALIRWLLATPPDV